MALQLGWVSTLPHSCGLVWTHTKSSRLVGDLIRDVQLLVEECTCCLEMMVGRNSISSCECPFWWFSLCLLICVVVSCLSTDRDFCFCHERNWTFGRCWHSNSGSDLMSELGLLNFIVFLWDYSLLIYRSKIRRLKVYNLSRFFGSQGWSVNIELDSSILKVVGEGTEVKMWWPTITGPAGLHWLHPNPPRACSVMDSESLSSWSSTLWSVKF